MDPDTYLAKSTVTWNPGGVRSAVISVYTYLSNYVKAIVTGRGGMIVYGDGGTTIDAIKYKTFDGTTWGTATATADVDGASTNKYLRAVRVYASASRNEKVMVSRHFNGTGQWIYAQVFNGTNWGNVVQLSTWNATSFLDVQNFSGTYLANGDFMVVYSDNTTTPKSRVWSGTAWATQTSMNVLSGAPIHVKIANRPGTNEVMAVFLNSANDTETEYNNGSGYATANWSAKTSHATNTVSNTKRIIDFDWSLNNSLVG